MMMLDQRAKKYAHHIAEAYSAARIKAESLKRYRSVKIIAGELIAVIKKRYAWRWCSPWMKYPMCERKPRAPATPTSGRSSILVILSSSVSVERERVDPSLQKAESKRMGKRR